jgi:proline racemase
MRTSRVFHAVDSHTEGMPTRVITGGVGVLPGNTMAERRANFIENLDELRQLLMYEPRGHSTMSGAILQPPTRPDADHGVLFIEVSGVLPMCGHGTIGVATVLVETGMVPVVEPVTTVRLDVPAGLVTVDVAVRDGRAMAVTIRNVPSFAVTLDAKVDVPGFGTVRYDLAYGGNFYAIVAIDELGLPFSLAAQQKMLDAGVAIREAINATEPPVHPEDPAVHGVHGVYLSAPDSPSVHSRHAMVLPPRWFDRSPCGTGTSARMAALHARGELALNTDFINESLLTTRFTGRLTGETTVAGRPAVLPTITGRAWITGTAQFMLDPDDPFPAGFLL